MAKVLYGTGAQSTLSGTINSAVTSLVVASAASFPVISGGSGDWFVIKADSELMKVTATSGPTFTVVRGFEGTSAASHTSGVTVTGVLTAAMLDQLKLDAGVGGASGNNGYSALGSTYSITGATDTYQDTGVSIAIPAAGTYLIDCVVTTILAAGDTNPTQVIARIYDSTNTAALSTKTIAYTQITPTLVASATFFARYVATGAATVKIQAKVTFTGTPVQRDIASGDETALRFLRIA